jgi:hypothetical protein
MGAFGEIAERLVERGYAPIPIIPGTKRPGILVKDHWVGLPRWQTRFDGRAPTEQEIARWSAGDAGVGIVGGPASHGTVAFDIDTEVPEIRSTLDTVLPVTPVRKVGRRGETLFYFAPHVTESRRWMIDGQTICELIGPGRQTILPPTIHPETNQPYRWSGLGGLDALDPDELPPLPPDIIGQIDAALARFGYQAAPATEPAGDSVVDEESPHRQLNKAALADLAAWVPALPLFRCRRTVHGYEAVATWRPSNRRRLDEKRALNLKITPDGIRDFGGGKGYTPLDLVMQALRCDLEQAFGFLGDRLGWTSATVQVPPEPNREPTQSPPEPLLPYADNVPGVLGEIVDWVASTSRRPNRVLALGTAVTVIGTLIGRRVAGPTRSATHLYVVGVAASGAGKQHVLDSAIRLMKAAGAGDHIGPSKFFSLSAMVDLLSYRPLALCVQDEIACF